jgi:hypothetical protein
MDLYDRELAERLHRLADQRAAEYHVATPFAHAVIDDFLPPEPLERALAEFPKPEKLKWIEFDSREEKKLAYEKMAEMPPAIREVTQFLASPVILEFLERLTSSI